MTATNKPCPFCGEPHITHTPDCFFVLDRRFRIAFDANLDASLAVEIEAAWNRRAPVRPEPAPAVDELLVMAVECGVIRLSQVMDADLQDALTAFAKRLVG